MEERLIFGRYRLLRKIGSGGMGEVFAALDLQSNEDVIIKISHPSWPPLIIQVSRKYGIAVEKAKIITT